VAKAVSGFRLATPKARMEYLGEISIIEYFWLLTVDLDQCSCCYSELCIVHRLIAFGF
jgi:hypothetical protein